jgi:hypothetical protein
MVVRQTQRHAQQETQGLIAAQVGHCRVKPLQLSACGVYIEALFPFHDAPQTPLHRRVEASDDETRGSHLEQLSERHDVPGADGAAARTRGRRSRQRQTTRRGARTATPSRPQTFGQCGELRSGVLRDDHSQRRETSLSLSRTQACHSLRRGLRHAPLRSLRP